MSVGASASGVRRSSARAGLQEAEFVALGVSQDLPGLLAACPMSAGRAPELEEAFESAVLIAVGGVDVGLQPQSARLGLGGGDEDRSRLQSAAEATEIQRPGMAPS